jgi:FkbH-like protein
MSNNLYSELAWLPVAPENFSEQCKQLAAEPAELGRRAQRLANHRLNESQLNRLSKALQNARKAGHSTAPLTPFRLGVLSNATSHFVVPALLASALRHGISLECVEAEYGQTMQTALDPSSALNQAQCDAVLVAIDHRGLPLGAAPGDAQAAQETVAGALEYLEAIRGGIRKNGKAVCILQTLPRPVESAFGSFDLVLPGTPRSLVDEVNRGIAQSVAGTEDLLLDVSHIAETVGLADWHDATLWNMAKVPFSSAFIALYADHVCRLIAALRGKSRKCLILDLDNTVWGGVIGDDGLDGIVLGQGDATGEAHLHVQRTALALRARGIVLAVSSKNTDEVARQPFRKHQEMLLREDHIAVFQANWNDKATNIKAIAEELSLGLDAMVFLDDNPMERDLVRQMLPQVAVPELPADPALYARTLLAAGYFEAIAFSAEDRKRAEFYQDNARRISLRAQAGDVDSYLRSLSMVMSLRPFDDVGRARIAQLINKSNQFNLTTRRYTEAEVSAAQHDEGAFTLQVRLADSFGDNGIISVLICRRNAEDWQIDTWLMSCRVLGRKVEVALLQELIMQARARGVRRLLGRYSPTEKNQLVENHYANLGFTLIAKHENGCTDWELFVEDAPLVSLPMTIERVDLQVTSPDPIPPASELTLRRRPEADVLPLAVSDAS